MAALRWAAVGAALLAGLSGGLAVAQEARPADERVRRLEARLERNIAGDFGQSFAKGVRGLAEYRQSLQPAKRARYVPVADGSVAPNTMQVFHWLNPEWEILSGAAGNRAKSEDVVATIADLDRQLAEADVELIVVPVPVRLMVYPELVAPFQCDEEFVGFAPGFTRFQLALLAAGVDVVDVLEPLARARRREPGGGDRDLVYLRNNSHWSPLGAAVAADVLADHLLHAPWMAELASMLGTESQLERVEVDRLEANSEGLSETLGEFVFDRVVDASGQLVDNTDRDSPVLLIGDSYARIFSIEGCDFARHLRHRLGFAPDVIASPGGGALSSRRMLARRPEPLAGKRAVIWLFTVRALIDGPKQWRTIDVIKK